MTERLKDDAYMTPPALCLAIVERLERLGMLYGEVLEPSCGTGNFLRAVFGMSDRPGLSPVGVEKDQQRALVASRVARAPRIIVGDFLARETWSSAAAQRILPAKSCFNLILGNPPFSLADAFVEKCMAHLAPGGTLAFLLRLGFLTGARRVGALYSQLPMPSLIPIVGRPAFRKDKRGTDFHDYAVFLWHNEGLSCPASSAAPTVYPHLTWKE